MREAHIETTPEGRVPVGEGWFVLNLGELAWETVPGFGVWPIRSAGPRSTRRASGFMSRAPAG